jgi:cell division protein FtsB
MEFGSRAFIWTLTGIAAGSLAAGVGVESRSLILGSTIVGAYALHLFALRTAVRSASSDRTQLESERLQLVAEREEVKRLQRSLEDRLARTEEQFSLLRDMVRERVRRTSGAVVPEGEDEPSKPPHREPLGTHGSREETDESHRGYGRW